VAEGGLIVVKSWNEYDLKWIAVGLNKSLWCEVERLIVQDSSEGSLTIFGQG
jgi:hypothetical protein